MCVAESLHSQGGSGAASAAGGVLPRPGFVSFEGLDLLAASLAPTEPCDGPGQRVTVLPQRQEGGWNQGSRGGGDRVLAASGPRGALGAGHPGTRDRRETSLCWRNDLCPGSSPRMAPGQEAGDTLGWLSSHGKPQACLCSWGPLEMCFLSEPVPG